MNRIRKRDTSVRVVFLLIYLTYLSMTIFLRISYNGTIDKIYSVSRYVIGSFGVIISIAYLKKKRVTLNDELSKIFKYTLFFLVFSYLTNFAIHFWFKRMGLLITFENQKIIDASLKNDLTLKLFLDITLIGPIFEESLYRFVPRRFLKNKLLFIIISSCIFAAMHCMKGEEDIFWVFLFYLPNALLYGYSYYKTNDLFVPMYLHITHNLLSTLLTIIF